MAAVHLTLRDMRRTALTKPQAAALRAVNKIDLTDIRARASTHERWTPVQARKAEKWYRGYLWLTWLHGKKPVFTIVPESDELWHAHIVYTKRYAADCRRIFGHFLDHTPTHRIDKRLKANAERSKDWYNKEFKQEFVLSEDLFDRSSNSTNSPIRLTYPCF